MTKFYYENTSFLLFHLVGVELEKVGDDFVGQVYWPVSNPGYHFYASNVPMEFRPAGTVLWADSAMCDPGIRLILMLNPVRYLLKGYRCCLLSGRLPAPDRKETIIFWCWTAGLLLLGARLMKRKEIFLADEV